MKKSLVIATTNAGKFNQLKGALESLDLELKSLADFPEVKDMEVVEDGKTEEENARIKAKAYGERLKTTVLGMDGGLYIEGLAEDLQPKQEVRRFWGDRFARRPTDEELLAHFSGVIRGLGGKAKGHWRFGVCLRNEEGRLFETVLIEPREFVWEPAMKVETGYPLESLQIVPEFGKYMSELSREEIARFWKETVGVKLGEFVRESLKV